MYELIQAGENSYYIQSPSKIGIYRLNETDVVFIDSGNDADAGRRARKILDANGWKLKAIYNTHSHSDHIGGNKYLQRQTQCDIYARGIERDFTCHTILEPSFLYGAFPHKDYRHKFILAQESDCKPMTQECLPEGFELIPLPGHSFDMVGFRTPDDVVYLADSVSNKEALQKYPITFIYDVAAYLASLELVKTLKAKLFIPSHCVPTEDIEDLAQFNIDTVNSVGEHIVELCSDPTNEDLLLKKLFDDYNMTVTTEEYLLVGSTMRSYLSWLKDTGRVSVVYEENMLKWLSNK